MTDPLDRLLVDADLRLEVDGLQARITAQGRRIDVETSHPVRLGRSAAQAVRAAGTRSRLRAGLSTVRSAGLTVVVSGRSGRLVEVGAGRVPVRLLGVARSRGLGVLAIAVLALGLRGLRRTA